MTKRTLQSSPGAALVTGGSRRIGRAIALSLSSAGYAIALHYNASRQPAQELAEEIRDAGGECEIFRADLASENETLKLIPNVRKKFPGLDLLINSASIFEPSEFVSSSLPLWDRHFAVNLRAPFILTCEFARNCKKGQVINMLDTHIVKNQTDHVAYLLTKKSLADMTKLAAVKLAPYIRVNGIAPGIILPPVNKTDAKINKLARNIPLKRKGDVANITRSVRFLVENDYLTGQILFNDGGEHLL